MSTKKMDFRKPATLPKNKFTKKNRKFAGWSKGKASNVRAYTNRAKNVKVEVAPTESKNVKFYAMWAVPTFKVAFDANGGEGTMKTQKFQYAKAKKLSRNKFTRENYEFIGWAKTKAAADAGKAQFKDGKKAQNFTRKGGTVKLYAVWAPVATTEE